MARIAGIVVGCILAIGAVCGAQFLPDHAGVDPETQRMIDAATVSKAFVIVASTPDYKSALRTVRKVNAVLSIRTNLRGLSFDAKTGLTFNRKECEADDSAFGHYPCYLARGRWDDGVYTSIERSDAYQGFHPGLYVVIVASGPPDDPDLESALARARTVFPSAYEKIAPIYVGCIH